MTCKHCSTVKTPYQIEHGLPADADTHTTEEHREDWVNLAEPCNECGAGEHEPCKPSCRWADCPTCGEQQDECDFGRKHE